MLDSFLSFVNEKLTREGELPIAESRWLLAVSGGIDSVVLTSLCYRAGIRFGIAHVNFQLRGPESEADEAFVRELAEKYGVPCHVTHFNTKQLAKERGISVQMAARELRYPWFEEVANEVGYDFIATAHHQNDVLETLLINLVRGTGMAGLRGVPIRQGRIIRPLWFATRNQIFAYLQQQGLTWREDSSNSDDKYLRNHLRHQVVPNLELLNPNFWGTFRHTIERIQAAETILDDDLARSWETIADLTNPERILIDVSRLNQLPEPAYRMTEWLRPFGFNGDQVRSIMKGLDQPPGQVYRSATHCIWHDRSGLIITPLSGTQAVNYHWSDWPVDTVAIAGKFRLTFMVFDKQTDYHIKTDVTVACLDADAIELPLRVRAWELGDRFQPLGMKGSKLVSDLLNDLKVPLSERGQVCVLLAAEKIVWVIGYRLAHPYRIRADTKRILEVSLSKLTDSDPARQRTRPAE